MNKHTPGPWIATHNSWDFSDVFGLDGKSVALCQISPDVTEDTQKDLKPIKEANARLIAAAPDLLEVLKDILNDGMHCDVVPHLHRKALAAIAKATGESK